MNNINLTVELCQDDRVRLDELANRIDTLIAVGLELAKKNVYEVAPAETRQEAAEATNTQTTETTHPVDAADVWSEPASEAPAVSGKLGDKGNEKLFSAVQQKVVKLSAAGKEKKASVREIVQKYATKVSDIPAEEYDAVMAALTALEG